MAMPNDDIKFVEVIVRLGNNPRFEIHADTRVRINPGDASFHCKALGDEDGLDALLKSVLNKLIAAYPYNAKSIALCIDGEDIVLESRCK
jgi:hypothetical protein